MDIDRPHAGHEARYPGPDYCYCSGCRTRFEVETDHTVTDWPADVRAGGSLGSPFLDWRREQITEFVESVYTAAKAIKPEIRVSDAVLGNYAWAYDGVGQDWVDWIDRGIVDFLCPMNYTIDHDTFHGLVAEQMAYAAGRIPIYPGIGTSWSLGALGPDGVIVQILATREAATGGFVLFNYEQDLATTYLPALGQGITIPGSVAETPDGRFVAGTPLSMSSNENGGLELQWAAACDHDPAITSYAVYRGTLTSLRTGAYDHVPAVCDTLGATAAVLEDESEDEYFLVVPNDTDRESGYGFDSAGAPRPVSATPCHPQSRAECP